ncbi:MAG: DNA gyrase subunit A, partial [Myxococcales bacterium]|nr:DNA gyrase subunit A [Myxococcales bacterium]
PTAGFVYGTSGIRQAFHTGRGRVVMRARAEFEPIRGKSDREQIVITELPYMVNKAELIKKIASLVREKRIEGISDLRDESDRDGMRMVIELKRDAAGQIVLNSLYQQTQLQSTFGVNQLAIVAGQPKLLTLKEALEHFIAHRRDVVTRRTRYELRQAEAQREIIEGLGMAVTEVDLVVNTIRQSKDPEEARNALMALRLAGLEEFVRRAGRPDSEIDAAKARGDYYLSERQARAILDMRLARLTGLEREKLAGEYGELCDEIARLRAILESEEELKRVIIEELDDVKERYGDDRRTEIVQAEGDISIEDLVADEDVVVTVSHAGYIKRVPATEYRAQGRGGRGKRAMETRDEDFVEQIFVANNHAHILYLSDRGIAYLKKVYEIPEASRSARGRAVVNFVGMEPGDRVASIVPIKEFREGDDLITCTRNGTVKRTSLAAYSNIRTTGIIGVALAPEDQLLAARVCNEDQEILIGTARGMSIRFKASDVRRMGRDARGVRGIDLRQGDHVIGMDVIQDDEHQVLCVSENGYGKRTPVADWRTQGRGGIGIIAMDASERNGSVVNLSLVTEDDQLMAITDGGQLIRTSLAEVRVAGRNTQGVRVIRLSAGERVVDVGLIAESDEDEDEEESGESLSESSDGEVSSSAEGGGDAGGEGDEGGGAA